ncbi:MAG TPA: hypothetical protein VFG10_12000 [Saprospiraceae bacterium]|nr:hypothetical protein [Saprospiraceae bacterium]
MKIVLIFLFIVSVDSLLVCQNTFIYNPNTPADNLILDVSVVNDTIFALETELDTPYVSNLLLLNSSGELLSKKRIDNLSFLAIRILSIKDSTTYLLGT